MPEAMIKIKFNIGDTVYRIKCDKGTSDLDIVCPVCDGTGKFISPISRQVHECPGVNGYLCKNGHMAVLWRNCYYPVRDVVAFICIERHNGIDKISYSLESGFDVNEDELYTTMDEVRAACDRKNGPNPPTPVFEEAD